MVLTQKNRGPSAARNKGLDQASGTYIAFADADDVCEARWLEKMLDAVKGKNCELAMCSWVKVNSEGEEMTDDFPRTLDLVDPVQFIPLLKGLGGAVWNKLFRRDIIERENIRFDPSKLRSEDFAFVLEYLVHVKRIALVSERLYRYRMMEQSLSHISDKGRLYLEICAGQYDALDQIQQKADPRLYGELVQYVVDTNINGLIYTKTASGGILRPATAPPGGWCGSGRGRRIALSFRAGSARGRWRWKSETVKDSCWPCWTCSIPRKR